MSFRVHCFWKCLHRHMWMSLYSLIISCQFVCVFMLWALKVYSLFCFSLCLGYYIGLGFVSQKLDLFSFSQLTLPWMIFLGAAIGTFGIGLSLFLLWKRQNWNNHPIAKSLGYHGNSWRLAASSINIEFRRIDKFQTGPAGRRTYVTDSWIIKTSPYSVKIAHQQDCHLNVVKTEEHAISHESSTGAQFVTLNVISLNENIPDFEIR